jgi:acetyl-CoA carboxylase biotin carboxyl carrier protein
MDDSVKLARDLARIARENELAEIEYRSGAQRIRLVLEAPPAPVAWGPGPMPAAEAAPAVAAPAPAPADGPKGQVISSPLAGVFYRAPRPGAPSFVEQGQQVSPGQTLCIIEAMKLMNEIGAEQPCTILKILVENAQVVESGQALFEIAPLG